MSARAWALWGHHLPGTKPYLNLPSGAFGGFKLGRESRSDLPLPFFHYVGRYGVGTSYLSGVVESSADDLTAHARVRASARVEV